MDQRDNPGAVKGFDDYFREEDVLEELCKERIRKAKQRHDRLFYTRIVAEERAPQAKDDIYELFPPRRMWRFFRPRRKSNIKVGHKEELSSTKLNIVTLKRAVTALRGDSPTPQWAIKLHKRIEAIRARALFSTGFRFDPPKIIPAEKNRADQTFRPIANFPLDDKIIDSLTARYLRQTLDGAFLKYCCAFRCRGPKGEEPPTIHSVMEKILWTKRRNQKSGVYVAECDIRAFFDCVAHSVARKALIDLIDDRNRKRGLAKVVIDPRAIRIFEAYLSAYSFERVVQGKAEKKLKKQLPKASFPWPTKELRRLHGLGATAPLPNIGVPQGGALSCFIANAVLHKADKEIALAQKKRKSNLLYQRYCDDMILLCSDRYTCRRAFDVYVRSLGRLLLPVHSPKQPAPYVGKGRIEFWDGKSHLPYRWSDPRKSRFNFPWIQFVGYQVRYDGLVRIRKKSLAKHRGKLREASQQLIRLTEKNVNLVRKTANQITHRLNQRLISMSVGRRKLGQQLSDPMPMCWCSGFRGLAKKKIVKGQLKSLDYYRELQASRVKNHVESLTGLPIKNENKELTKVNKFHGKPFSYVGQLT